MAIAKKSLLGKNFSKAAQSAKSTSSAAKAPVNSKLVSARLTSTKISTSKIVVGKTNLMTGRMYF